MNRTVLILVALAAFCHGREPFKAIPQSINYAVYFSSRYRGICVGTLVARTVVLTAAVCVVNPYSQKPDKRPITVITGTFYRHPRRGIRVRITHVIIPYMPPNMAHRNYLLMKSAAVMLMQRRVPDILAEVNLRGLYIDWQGERPLSLHEECVMTGWHFFYRGDKIFPVHKFLLQRNIRAQFLNIVKMHAWCEPLHIRLNKALAQIGFYDFIEKGSMICVKDGMYGGPLICGGRAVGMMMAPDAQWVNCTGQSNIIHLFNGPYLKHFFECVSKLFQPEVGMNWDQMKRGMYDENAEVHDYIPAFYDKMVDRGESSDDSGSYSEFQL